MKKLLLVLALVHPGLHRAAADAPAPARIAINLDEPGKPISPDLVGIFFEDINYAADGGLYAELIQNRSFEYDATEQTAWGPLTSWEFLKRGGGDGGWSVDAALPVHPNDPRCVVVDVAKVGEGVGLANSGFDGIAVKGGESYDFSCFARQLYMNTRWGAGSAIEGKPMPVSVRLEGREGEVLGEASLEILGREWKRLTASITASRSEDAARFVLLAKARGGIALDELSLFPRKTFRGRTNGLRADLAQVVADLHPKFVRFPGGCVAHGSGLNNIYRWKDTIGPIEQRRGQRNLWGYHQSVGLGYFEYFQFCEDIGAKPLPVVAAAVSCQNSGHTSGVGQQCLLSEDMPAYIQDLMDLVEYANGPADSKWGAKRAAAGHPAPFGLKYLGVGNEDHITPGFRERFQMIYEAIRARHPEITVIGTVGPSPKGQDFTDGWKLADELKVPVVDEHYYEKPDWFWKNLPRYDAYDRARSKVYLGEYAAHDDRRLTTLRSALAEAAYLTGLERNADVVPLASYAPLFGKKGHTQWNPDLIYFTNTEIAPTVNYYVQQLFGCNGGDFYLPAQIEDPAAAEHFAVSAVRDSGSGDVILKLVNGEAGPKALHVELGGAGKFAPDADKTVLASLDPTTVNTFGTPKPLVPETSAVTVGPAFDYEAPPYSLTVVRLKPGGANR